MKFEDILAGVNQSEDRLTATRLAATTHISASALKFSNAFGSSKASVQIVWPGLAVWGKEVSSHNRSCTAE